MLWQSARESQKFFDARQIRKEAEFWRARPQNNPRAPGFAFTKIFIWRIAGFLIPKFWLPRQFVFSRKNP